MLGGDVFVLQHPRLFHRLIDDALQPRGDEDLSDRLRVGRRPGRARRALKVVGQALFHGGDGRAHALQHLHDEAFGQLQHRQEEVLDVDLGVVVALHDFISPPRGFLCLFCKPIKSHHRRSASHVLRNACCVNRTITSILPYHCAARRCVGATPKTSLLTQRKYLPRPAQHAIRTTPQYLSTAAIPPTSASSGLGSNTETLTPVSVARFRATLMTSAVAASLPLQ